MIADAIGTCAAIASISSFAPQAWRIIKTRETDDLSLPTWIFTVVGFVLWSAYGVLLGSIPLAVENVVCFSFAAFILVMKVLPQRHVHRIADALDPSAHHVDVPPHEP
jgi:MtN3 and saliva related transmembrane protein